MTALPASAAVAERGPALRQRALRFIVALWLVSLFADVVYEGGRAILGPYLGTLGASSATVGLIAGAGEFAGYALRVAAGYASDRTGRYWALTFAGYGLTAVSVPLLGVANSIALAFALVVGERLGKAVRTPARDTLLSFASHAVGRGYGFGLHEALDQIGAVAGPLLLAALLAAHEGDYELAFLSLAAPAALSLAALSWARLKLPHPRDLESPAPRRAGAGAASGGERALLRRYLAFTFVAVLGFAPFPVIGLDLVRSGAAPASTVALLFALAMASDAGVALLAGRAYDRRGLAVLALAPLLIGGSLLAFTGRLALAVAGAGLWGAAMGLQEATMRAAVADIAPIAGRGLAYGTFNAVYGLGLLAGAAAIGALAAQPLAWLALYVLATQALAAAILATLLRRGTMRG